MLPWNLPERWFEQAVNSLLNVHEHRQQIVVSFMGLFKDMAERKDADDV